MIECRYNGNCCVMYHRPFDSDDLPCVGYDEDICSLYKPMPDVKALAELADEMENNTWYETGFDHRIAVRFARRIREALGEAE